MCLLLKNGYKEPIGDALRCTIQLYKMKDMALTHMGMSILLIKYFYAHANLDLCNHIKLLCTWLILLFNLKLQHLFW